MSLTPEEQTIRQMSDEAFKDHQITEHARDGMFRSWRCQKPGTWTHGFDITTTPGYLFLTGDLGGLIVSREWDMLPWARAAVDDIHYFSSKCEYRETAREFSEDALRKWLADELSEARENEESELIARIIEASRLVGYEDRSWFYRELQDLFDDPPSWSLWAPQFCWKRDAIRWFVMNHSEPEIKTSGPATSQLICRTEVHLL